MREENVDTDKVNHFLWEVTKAGLKISRRENKGKLA